MRTVIGTGTETERIWNGKGTKRYNNARKTVYSFQKF